MRQIELIGPVDKRVIAYPLFRMCNILGKTLVVTDDANFRVFAEKYNTEFTVDRSDFVITPDISKTLIEELGMKLSTYDYVIFISTNTFISGNDNTVYCHGINQSICTPDVIDDLEINTYTEVVISTRRPSDKETQFISVDGKGLKYVWDCEENKEFLPCNNPELIRVSSFLFTNTLGVASKEEYAKILQRNDV